MIKIFQGKQKLKEFIIRPALQEMLKQVLQTEIKGCELVAQQHVKGTCVKG